MIHVKVKFRQSTVKSKKGVLFYQLINNRRCRHIATSYKIYSQEWNVERSLIVITNAEYQRRHDLQLIEKSVIKEVTHLQRIISDEEDIDRVVREFNKIRNEKQLFVFGERIAGELRDSGRIKTAMSYKTAIRSFLKFQDGKDIPFEEITSRRIKQYEQYLKAKQVCNNTISFYMRVLRAIYNRAVYEGYTEQAFPFAGVYVGIDKTVKRAVDQSIITRLKSLDLTRTQGLQIARDMFMFSFYTRGMAFVDVAYLTKENVKGDYIVYQRHKTGQALHIRIEPCIKKIIAMYAHLTAGSHYLMPVLVKPGSSYQSAIRLQNLRLHRISGIMGLPEPLTSYVARHSWATLAKRKGVPIRIISESMGHTNEKTTRIYLSSLDRSVIDGINAKLLSEL